MDAVSDLAPAGGQGDLADPEVEWQRLFMDLKASYQSLKAEHTGLQTEYAGSQNELQQLRQEKQSVQDKLQALFAAFREELAEKTREMEELKSQMITPEKLGQLKAQIQQELEEPMRERFRELDEEVGKNRAEYNRLRLEHNLLKSEFERQKEDHACGLDESTLKYESKALTPRKMELLTAQMQHHMEAAMGECFWKLEVGKKRANYNKLGYKHNFLKSGSEYQKEEHPRFLEESKLRYRSEVARSEKNDEDLHNQLLNADLSRGVKQGEALLREKTQLVQKLKGLEAEAAEIRARTENSGMQVEDVQTGPLAEMQAAVRSLEAEKQSVKLQLERTEKELLLNNKQNLVLIRKLPNVFLETSALTTKAEEVKHSSKLKLTDIELEAAHARSETETEINKLLAEADELFSDNEILKTSLKQLLVGKDCELIGQVQAAKEEDSQYLATVLEKKFKLETKLVETEKNEQDCERQLEEDQYEKEISAPWLTEMPFRRRIQKFKLLLQEQLINSEELEKESSSNGNPMQHIQDFQLSEASFWESIQKNQEILEKIKHGRQNARSHVERAQSNAVKSSVDKCVEWMNEQLRGYSQLIGMVNREFTEKSGCKEKEMKDSCSF